MIENLKKTYDAIQESYKEFPLPITRFYEACQYYQKYGESTHKIFLNSYISLRNVLVVNNKIKDKEMPLTPEFAEGLANLIYLDKIFCK